MVDVRIFPVSCVFETVIKITTLVTWLLVIGGSAAIILASAISISQYTVSVSTLPSGLNPQPTGGGTYDSGTTATVIAQPVEGYMVRGWNENMNQVSTDTSYSFTVTGDRNLVAEYIPNNTPTPTRYTVSISILPSGLTPQPTGEGTYLEGQTVKVTAQSVIGYTFQKWTENGGQISTDTSYQFTVTGNRRLVAEYSPTSPPTSTKTITPTVSPTPTVTAITTTILTPTVTVISALTSTSIPTPTPTIPPKAGSISVSSTPSGASIYLDGSYMGTTPETLTGVEAGSHTITLKLTDYQEWSQIVNVADDKTSDVSVQLKKVDPFLYGAAVIIALVAVAALRRRGSHKSKPIETEIPDKIPAIKKGTEELKEKIERRVPHISVTRSTSEISFKEGEKLDVKIELKNEGEDIARSVSLSDRVDNGLKIISGENSWTGDINQDAYKVLKYTIKADRAGKYTIPRLIVSYKDKRGKTFEKAAAPIEIEVTPKAEVITEVETASKVEKPPKNAYGVVIGIGRYEDPGIPILRYAKEDALEIYNILTDPEHGNFPKENVKLLLDEQATLTEIKSAMGTFLARKAGKDDVVCIYFAGHGSPEIDPTGKSDDRLEKFMVPYDAKRDDLFSYGLSMDMIRNIYERIESKRVIFFIDSCYSGEAGGRAFSRPDVRARNISVSEKFLDQLSGEGRIIITASKPDELSLETDEFKHGIFTYYLAEGLKGKADFDKDGVVSIDELYTYVYDKVSQKARLLGARQHPLKKGTLVGAIPLTYCKTKSSRYSKAI